MCRKCFYAYDKYIKLQDTILENIRKASDVLELDLDVQPGPDSSRTTGHSAITGLSPEVAVGSYVFSYTDCIKFRFVYLRRQLCSLLAVSI